MRSPVVARQESDDLFAHTRMSFGDHIEELRLRMIRALLGLVVAMLVGLAVGKYALEFIQMPIQNELDAFYGRQAAAQAEQLKEQLKAEAKKREEQGDPDLLAGDHARELQVLLRRGPDADWEPYILRFDPRNVAEKLNDPIQKLTHPGRLTSLSVTEPFFTYFLVSFYCGAILASPWMFYQMWMFISAGLYPQEKKLVHVYLPFSIVLFLAGVALCEFAALPMAIHYLLGFNEWLGIRPELRLTDWLTFATIMPLIFGLAFQTPIVMFGLERLGIVPVEVYTKHRRIALFGLAAAAAFLAPGGDITSMVMLLVPLWVLYEFGILMCKYVPKPKDEFDVPDPEEMVEV
jgi:sec-independent protein translocase protein TatC